MVRSNVMNEQDVKELKDATERLNELQSEYDLKIAPFIDVRNKHRSEITDWFNGFIETDPKMKELLVNVYSDTNVDMDDEITFKVGEWDYDNVYIQHFECSVPIDDIADVINGKKSLWDYGPNTDKIIY